MSRLCCRDRIKAIGEMLNNGACELGDTTAHQTEEIGLNGEVARFDPAELIVDREISSTSDDELGHSLLAAQLARLCRSVPSPSNIALYGPWGSGKSGIGRLLATEINEEEQRSVRFARFDAFKYAEAPLRRSFVSAIATELGIDDRKFHSDLYSAYTKKEFDIPGRNVRRILVSFVLSMLLVGILIFLAILFISIPLDTPYGQDVSQTAKQAFTAGIAPAALVAALLTYASNWLATQRVTEKASSDEEFEDLFRDLVQAARTERVVIFVDELDR